MSRYSRDHSQSGTNTKPPFSKRNGDPIKTAEQVNSILRRLRDATLPREPYLVSVPSNVPYNHSRRYVPTWHNCTPFTKDEEQLQYLSFVPSTIEDTLLSVVGGWSDEQGNLLPDEEEQELSPRSKPATSRNSPVADIQRKKISLGQYKTKVKGEAEMTTDTPPRRDMEKQASKVNGIREAEKADAKVMRPEPLSPRHFNDRKHPRDEDLKAEPKLRGGNISAQPQADRQKSMSPRPAKKPKLETSPPPKKHEPQPATEAPRPSLTKAEALPGLLSPTLPPKPQEEPILPPLLSPTIPPSIQEFLDIEPTKLDKALDRHRTDSVRNLLATAGVGDPGVGRKSPGLLHTNGADRMRSDSAHSARSTHSAVNGLNRVAALAQSPSRGSTPTRNGTSPGPRQRHTIILKYGKRNRKRIKDLLKLASRPNKARTEATAAPASSSHPVKRKLETIREVTPSKDKPRESTSDGVAKHQKARPAALSVSERPSTPIHAALNSPSVAAHPPQPRSTFSTPRKELKSTAMQRVVSSEGVSDARTPQADRLSTPQPATNKHSPSATNKLSPSATNKLSPSAPTSAPSASSSSRDEWTALAKKYFDLGRKIKNEGTSFGTDASGPDHSLFTVLIIEGLLCFMINAFAMSAASIRPGNDPGWRGIVPYLDFVLNHTRKTPYLHGIAMQLGALCRQHVSKYDMEKLAKEALPDDQSASAPTPGSDGNTKTGEDSERAKQRYLDFRDQLISNARRCQSAWLEGSRLLSPEVLREEFPMTWKRRATDYSLRGMERPAPRELGGSFFLPLDGNATALEGVRYAVEVLQEWCEREKVDWRCRIEL
jgi:hypothetical protein